MRYDLGVGNGGDGSSFRERCDSRGSSGHQGDCDGVLRGQSVATRRSTSVAAGA